MSSGAATWPGSVPTLDMVMWDIRKVGERLTHFSSLMKYDADFLRRMADYHSDPVRHPHPVATAKQKSVFVRTAEAQLLFHAYCDAEARRLGEKATQLEAGTLDVASDRDWRQRNERMAVRAISLAESAALPSHQGAGEP